MSQGKHFEVVRELRNQYAADEVLLESADSPPTPEASSGKDASTSPGEDTGARIQARVAELVPELGEWQQSYSAVMAASRLTTVAQAIVVPVPEASFEQHLLLAKLGLVDFAMDDVADGEMGSLTDDQLREAYTRYHAETARLENKAPQERTGAQDAASILGSAIQEVARELHASPGKAFLPLWQEHFRRFCVGHLRELEDKRKYQSEQRLPSLKHYLTMGWWSSGAPMYFSAMLVVRNPSYEDTSKVLEDPLILRAFRYLGLAIRWFNDARSLSRELDEGKFNNSLILLMEAWRPKLVADKEAWVAAMKTRLARKKTRSANDELETMAEAMAVARGDRNLEALRRTVSRMPPELQPWGKGMVTLVQLSRRVYLQHGEFHHAKPDTSQVAG